jgi:hypothetical protein
MFGLPIAVRGYWLSDNTLAIEYNELCRIQDNKMTITFSGNKIDLTINESTKDVHERLVGQHE